MTSTLSVTQQEIKLTQIQIGSRNYFQLCLEIVWKWKQTQVHMKAAIPQKPEAWYRKSQFVDKSRPKLKKSSAFIQLMMKCGEG